MILLTANLVAGPKHPRLSAGHSLVVMMFVDSDSENEALKLAESELEDLGWATFTHESTEVVPYNPRFEAEDSPQAQAFRTARATGFGLVVFPDASI
jgi:hypothetical protein